MDSLSSPADISAGRTSLIIKPRRGWGNLDLGELWPYRSLIWTLIARDVKARYRQTALGPLWFFISPFVNLVVMSMIFGGLAKMPSEGLPYPLFLFAATLPWTFFAMTTTSSSSSLTNFMSYMTKVYFPRLIAPIVSVVTGLADWAISLLLLIGLMIFYHVYPSLAILALPLYLLMALMVGLAVGLWSATLAVWFRDLSRVITYGLQLWYFCTPVLYSSSLVPARWEWLYQLNPMFWVVEGFRWSLLGKGRTPEPIMLIPLGFFFLLLVSGVYVFQRTTRSIVDIQ